MICAVIGSPIDHSLSPVMHRAAYAELGLDWTYEAVEVREGELGAFVGALGDDVRGLSVTAPLKREAAAAAQQHDGVVDALGVANTLVVDDGVLSAYNTDVPGAAAAIAQAGIAPPRSARILGGGATAASIALTLVRLGVEELSFVVRDEARAADAVEVARGRGIQVRVRSIDEPLIAKVDLLVSTVPDQVIGSRSYELVDSSRAVFDVVYDPWPTNLVRAAHEAGTPVVSGIDLLAHQAALQVELMTGSTVSPQLLRDAALSALSPR
ncbi:shikimate dehydrogenase [Aeromicrobium chenweiae]|uniref:Shikimate dehydrogenase n=1 Tax=Aeromicrobium chenweiae TaxID=2079793 RepID=A0A2S0WMM8_9ACTN|nr:shikimate dehydrogenase [Aeromicrobium chenweiae]AWB92552.1 shikimate dehydrogenase [Aeromicrobium chenweiae]TGN33540.1 shikimate dehydrogenase [Aeromicrobium chenweiae]